MKLLVYYDKELRDCKTFFEQQKTLWERELFLSEEI